MMNPLLLIDDHSRVKISFEQQAEIDTRTLQIVHACAGLGDGTSRLGRARAIGFRGFPGRRLVVGPPSRRE